MKKKRSFEPKWIIVLVFFFAGIALGVLALFTWFYQNGSSFGLQKIHSKNPSYKYINPLLAVDKPNQEFLENKILEAKIKQSIDKRVTNQDIKNASVYFRDFESGRWVGINEELKFSPGLLLKIPIMIAYYKASETNPNILSKELIYNLSAPVSSTDLTGGKRYLVDKIIDSMITNDDDSAASLLYDNVDKPALDEVFSDLGIDFREDKTTADFISIKSYSLIFRVLYNSTYLNRELSEKALDLLSQTDKNQGLAGAIPSLLTVAHKYHERTFKDGKNSLLFEIHDCGIVYYPQHPYIVCVMGVGKKAEAINSLFRDISADTYEEMSTRYKTLE